MIIDGARIYNDDVGIGHESEEKIRQIVTAIKSLSPSSDIGLRVVKCGRTYEGLLWGKAANVSIGVYHRGCSVGQVLEIIHKKVKKRYLKSIRRSRSSLKPANRSKNLPKPEWAVAIAS